MCGIVGLFLKDKTLEPELGRLTAGTVSYTHLTLPTNREV